MTAQSNDVEELRADVQWQARCLLQDMAPQTAGWAQAAVILRDAALMGFGKLRRARVTLRKIRTAVDNVTPVNKYKKPL